MTEIDFISKLHRSTQRDYLERVVQHDKAACAEVALRYGKDYWDGERRYGYGGFCYDGRWASVAKRMVEHYGLKGEARILDVGCGKGFLLHEFKNLLPDSQVHGVDISEYALANAKSEVKEFLQIGNAQDLQFEADSFDLVVSVNTFHNLFIGDLWSALTEVERVGKSAKYIVVESYRTEQEKANLLYWQLTCRAFHTPVEWNWIFEKTQYRGDYGFIFFE